MFFAKPKIHFPISSLILPPQLVEDPSSRIKQFRANNIYLHPIGRGNFQLISTSLLIRFDLLRTFWLLINSLTTTKIGQYMVLLLTLLSLFLRQYCFYWSKSSKLQSQRWGFREHLLLSPDFFFLLKLSQSSISKLKNWDQYCSLTNPFHKIETDA